MQEVESGRLSQRAVERTYKINRRTIDSWITQFSLLPLASNGLTAKPMKEPNESSKIKLLSKQVSEVQKALEKANLNINRLETLIQVSEEELKIKIRKRPGAKQSKE
ncbi:transposase [Chryseobacterium pennae]|uniref:Transposase n=1 Tax=Chryseobacterium pennae TaxID=2258962 RepID=A0A3D9C179_9FLAO|nr:transposase [Chryseobacterium pennae]REC59221.1 transposase [Chryseobacterium pennae]